jgi:hypothetical protein
MTKRCHPNSFANIVSHSYQHKFDPSMLNIARGILENGGTQAMVAAELKVSVRSLQRWKKHDDPHFQRDFCAMWEEAMAHNESFYDKIAMREMMRPTENFNPVLYQMFRRNVHGWTEHRRVAIEGIDKAATYQEQAELLRANLAAGLLTPAEFNLLHQGLSNTAMKEIDDVKIQVEELKEKFKNA